MLDQFIRVRRPIDFDLRHKMRKRVRLDTNGWNAQFFAFNNGCAGAAERIEDTMARVDAKTFKVLANHVWRKGQHEAIPVVCRAILIVYLVDIALVSVMTAFVLIRHRCRQRRFGVLHAVVPSKASRLLSFGHSIKHT